MEYFPRIERIADKVLWGTDWPGPGVPEIKGNIEKFKALPIRAEAKRRILRESAARLFPRSGGSELAFLKGCRAAACCALVSLACLA